MRRQTLDVYYSVDYPPSCDLHTRYYGPRLSSHCNLVVARHYLNAEAALRVAVPTVTAEQLDPFDCTRDFTGDALVLCQTAADREAFWVNFKLFGLLGLTVVFILGQALYLGRYIGEDDDTPDGESPSESTRPDD